MTDYDYDDDGNDPDWYHEITLLICGVVLCVFAIGWMIVSAIFEDDVQKVEATVDKPCFDGTIYFTDENQTQQQLRINTCTTN